MVSKRRTGPASQKDGQRKERPNLLPEERGGREARWWSLSGCGERTEESVALGITNGTHRLDERGSLFLDQSSEKRGLRRGLGRGTNGKVPRLVSGISIECFGAKATGTKRGACLIDGNL